MSDWRARPHVEPRPPSVGGVVRTVRAGLRAAHAVECALFFAAGALLARSALLLSGAPVDGGGGWGLALLCGGLCAASWWLEHPVELAATAQALDRRLRHDGALATAFELEERGTERLTSMEELVRLRVLERLRPAEAMRALFPPLLLPIAAPTVAALLLVMVVDGRRAPEPASVDFGALAEGLERALELGARGQRAAGSVADEEEGGALARRELEGLSQVLQGRGALPSSSEEWTRDPASSLARLEELDQRVADLAARIEPAEPLRERLVQARSWLDAMRMALQPVPQEPGEPRADGTGAQGLTGATANGTISRPHPGPAPPPMPIEPAPIPTSDSGSSQAQPLGLQAGSWWPAEYDPVVERWVELTRAARAGDR